MLRVRLSAMPHGDRKNVLAILELVPPGSKAHFDAVSARARLRSRERQVAALAIQGLGNRQIGLKLGISPVTVGVYLSRVYRRTGTTNRNELTYLLMGGASSGSVPPEQP